MRNSIILVVLFFIVFACCKNNDRMLQKDSYDPLCRIVDKKTGNCDACICRAYFDENRICRAVSDLCKTWNINVRQCTSCYRGYELINGTCITIPVFIPGNQTEFLQNPNCQTQDDNGTCLTCRPYYLLHCNDCQTTGENPFCAKFNQNNICQKCDQDYELDINNICQALGNNTNNQTDNSTSCEQFSNCAQCNSTECTKCTEGAIQEYYSRNCVIPTTNCNQGCAKCSPNECFACSQGYSAQSWPICIYCSYMYARDSTGKCKAMQRDCSAFENCQSCVKTECLYCNQGYKLDADLKCVATP